MRTYQLQDAGLDTFDANNTLGFDDDERDYGIAARMLRMLSEQGAAAAVLSMTNSGAWFAAITGSNADPGQAMTEEFVRNSVGLERMQELHRQFDAAAAS
jgi:hypothetical protein